MKCQAKSTIFCADDTIIELKCDYEEGHPDSVDSSHYDENVMTSWTEYEYS